MSLKQLKRRGFTLIETLIYIALFTILIGAGFFTAFSLLQSGESLTSKTVSSSELDFVLKKINWAANSASNLTVISPTELNITRYSTPTLVKFRFNQSKNPKVIEIDEGSGVFIPLTTVNVEVSKFEVQLIAGTPNGVKFDMMIDGISAATTKYIRK